MKRAIPVDRTANTALAWRYPTRIPAAQTIRSPPMPGRAIAASADSDAGARTIIFFGKRLAEKAGWDIAHATAHLRLIVANTTLERGCSRWYDYSPWLSFSSAA